MGNCKSQGATSAVAPVTTPSLAVQAAVQAVQEQRLSFQADRRVSENGALFGKNVPLRKVGRPWKSDVLMTRKELQRKRLEFWDTSPAFGGRKEIWDALRAAVETEDRALAQAILDGASISLPTGQLTDAYDELGHKYTIPMYCLSDPSNLIESINAGEAATDANGEVLPPGQKSGEERSIKLRLSTNKDLKLKVDVLDTIGEIKLRIEKDEGIAPADLRMFFGGKELDDMLTIRTLNVPPGFMIQAIVRARPAA
eukprot:Opistho-2@53823